MAKVSPANEDYLEMIVILANESGGPVRSVDLARRLDVSKPSVNKAVSTLKGAGLVTQRPYGDVMLTDEGRRYGEAVLQRHHVLSRFLTNELGVDPEVADEEACLMEHAISDSTLEKWEAYLAR